MSDAARVPKRVPEKQKRNLMLNQEEDRMDDEEKLLDGRPDVDFPALLTKDVPGG